MAIKTDKTTLLQRRELHEHQRNVAESDADKELQLLRDAILSLNIMIMSVSEAISIDVRSQIRDLICKIESTIDVMGKAHLKISSRSELFGAVRQEEKLSNALDVIIIHVENLKNMRNNAKAELEDAKQRIALSEKRLEELSGELPGRRARSISTTNLPRATNVRLFTSYDSSRKYSNLFLVTQGGEVIRRSLGQHNMRYLSSNGATKSRRCSMPTIVANPSRLLNRTRFITDAIGAIADHCQLALSEEKLGLSDLETASGNGKGSDSESIASKPRGNSLSRTNSDPSLDKQQKSDNGSEIKLSTTLQTGNNYSEAVDEEEDSGLPKLEIEHIEDDMDDDDNSIYRLNYGAEDEVNCDRIYCYGDYLEDQAFMNQDFEKEDKLVLLKRQTSEKM